MEPAYLNTTGKSRRKLTFEDERVTDGRNLSHAPSTPFMSDDDTRVLGRCPDCGKRISQAWLLVEYEKDTGETGIWAECPDCEDVVAPE